MTLIEDILDRYLYKEDVQQLAAERGLPTSWTKPEIIVSLLRSGRFNPADAVAYLNVRDLRRLCREWRLSSEGDRDTLVETVLAAIWEELDPTPPRTRSKSKRKLSHAEPATTAAPAPLIGAPSQTAQQTVGSADQVDLRTTLRETLLQPARPPGSESNHIQSTGSSRIHPDTTGPWTAVAIVSTAVIAVFSYAAIAALGFVWGGASTVIVAVVLVVALMLTSHRWIPRLARTIRLPPPT